MRQRRRTRKPTAIMHRRRLLVLALLGIAGYLTLAARAVQLQALDAEWLSARADAQHTTTLQLKPLRGELYDRNRNLLAVSADVESIVASPKRVVGRDTTATKLASALKLKHREIFDKLDPDRSFAWIKRWVTPDEADRIRKLDLPGIKLYPERKRFYPHRGLAASYLGFVGRDGEGLTGLELAFDSALRGTAQSTSVLRDAKGKKLVHWNRDAPSPSGARIVLSIDSRLQNVAEQSLQRAVDKWGAKHGTLVALDPWNGDILALAEVPTFNPNQFWREDSKRFRTRAVVDAFEPGSTLKPFVIALALEAGVVKPTDRFDCENGSWKVRDRIIRDFKPHGVLNVKDIMRVSSNIGTAKIADRLGSAQLVDGLRRQGFGRRTNSGFPGESPGVVHTIREKQAVERANLAFGQGIMVTPLQLAVAGAQLANGGQRVWPRLATRIESGQDEAHWPAELGERVMPEKVTKQVLKMLEAAVSDGSGKGAALPHHSVAGKTGTAQKVVNGRYSSTRYYASFLGIVPVENPKLVIAIVIDEPRRAHTGGVVAAPVFREVAGFAVEQMGLAAEGAE